MTDAACVQLASVWAKTGADGSYHPLVLHMIDVGAVARVLWDRVCSEQQRTRLAHGLGLPSADAGAWLVLLAALHDLGKCSPAFQRKAPERVADLRRAGLVVAESADAPHGAVSTFDLDHRLRAWGCDRSVANALAVAVGGHHGSFPSSRLTGRRHAGLAAGDDVWAGLRDAHVAALERLVGRPAAAPLRCDAGALIAVAGLTTVADWIGSDERRFGFDRRDAAQPLDLVAHLTLAHERAERAITDLRWADRGLPGAVSWASTFQEAFPDLGGGPRGAQAAVVEMVASTERPHLLLVESETGSGKTEAAFWAVLQALRRGASGAYVALPTQATANQMHSRFAAFLRHGLDVNGADVGLLHGSAALAVDEQMLSGGAAAVEPAHVYDADPGTAAPTVDARAWFQQRKRGLLAPFAVGTVDQALLGVLPRRHFFVRLWGLAGAVVVIDEVHAYDAYTSHLLESLVRWLAGCGSTVVLLSATLAPRQRRALIDAYRDGAGWSDAGSDPRPPRYPRVTLVSESATHARTVGSVRAAARREITLRWDGAAEDPERLAERVLSAIERGGCAAVVCNTVGLAQRRFAALRAAAPPDVRLELLHARMRHRERAAVERGLVARYGPAGERPERAVVVATQVVEQSLDVDFDAMWSDLAPIDLLVQRAGRIMRHDRPRPAGFAGRVLTVLVPRPDDVTAQLEASTRIYGEAALLRTRLVLGERAAIREPDDLDELIAAVYEGPAPACDPAAAAHLADADEAAWHRRRRLSGRGQLNALPDPSDPELLRRLRADDLTDPERDGGSLGTRWDELPSMQLIVLRDGELVRERAAPASLEDARALLAHSVSIPVDRGRAARLRAQLPHAAWRHVSLLRHHALVELDCQDRASLDDLTVEWDETLGLILDRTDDP